MIWRSGSPAVLEGPPPALKAHISLAHRICTKQTALLRSLSTKMIEYDSYDALGLADLIAQKQITPLELLDAVRQRVAAINPKINAFSQIFFDKAEAQPPQPFLNET